MDGKHYVYVALTAFAFLADAAITDDKYTDSFAFLQYLKQLHLEYFQDLLYKQEYTVCGEGYCLCKDTKADCFGLLFSLAYIPSLPAETRELNMSWNIHLRLDRDDVFENVTNVTSLDLSYSAHGWSNVSAAAFRSFRNLTSLSLNGNNLSYSYFNAFCVETLKTLRLDACDLGPLPNGIFRDNPMPRLQALYLRHNHLGPLTMSIFQPLVSLTDLLADNNQIWNIIPDYLPKLNFLSLNVNPLSMWDTCKNGESLFPNLETLLLVQTTVSKWDQDLCLPKLQNLALAMTGFFVISTDMFTDRRFPALQVLVLNSIPAGVRSIQARAFQSPTLTSLGLSENSVDFASKAVDDEGFVGCPNLQRLDVKKNDFRSVTADRFLTLFGHLIHLVYVDLSSSNIRNISAKMFSRFVRLKNLKLDNNRLAVLPNCAFDNVAPGAEIYLQNNQIEIVQEAAFSPAINHKLSHLDLSENPFLCSCDLRWFRNWLAKSPFLFQNSKGFYKCDNLPNTEVVSFFVVDQACVLSHQTSLLIIVTVSLIILSFTTVSLLYRYRWHFRLIIYEAFRGRGFRQQHLQQQHFDYDVFVSYDSEDSPWVHQHLVPKLEESMGLKLCLHERDFIPGKSIVENISELVESSKKVMMLFSTGFAHSPWCQFELNLCLTYVMNNDDMLLVVLLEDIPSRDLTSAMMAVMKTTTYIEWGEEDDAKHSFWRRIQISLAEIVTRV